MKKMILIIGSLLTIVLIILWYLEIISEPFAALGAAILTFFGYLFTDNNGKIKQIHHGSGDIIGGDKVDGGTVVKIYYPEIPNNKKSIIKLLLIIGSLTISISFGIILIFYTPIKNYFSHPQNKASIPQMIKIPSGKYWIGLSKEDIKNQQALFNNDIDFYSDYTPNVEIDIDSFYISQYEISNQEYNEFLKDRNQVTIKNNLKLPITGISWFDAVNYCDWISNKTHEIYRLPFEFEWEIAAKGNTDNIFTWGNRIPNANNCNFKFSNKNSAIEINSSPYNISEFGVYNMNGNVSEWCNDWYYLDYYNLIKDSLPKIKNMNLQQKSIDKVIRGGSYRDIAFDVRITSRKPANPNLQENHIGFRIIKICQTIK